MVDQIGDFLAQPNTGNDAGGAAYPEGFRPIPGNEKYFADGNGNIWSSPRKGNSKKWTRPATYEQDGYLIVQLRSPGQKKRACKVHRLILLAFNGNPPEGKEQVRHLNGDKKDNRPENLCWGDSQENAADRERHGTSQHGERAGRSKLSVEYVRDLKRRNEAGEKINVGGEAKAQGRSYQTIKNILVGRSWLKDDDSVRRKRQPSPICEPASHAQGQDPSPFLEEMCGLWRRLTECEQQKFIASIQQM